MSENQDTAAPDQEAPAEYKISPENDGVVEAVWSVAVIPNENVSIHYTVRPVHAENAVTSVTTSFVLMQGSVVHDTFAGSTTQDLIDPRNGQGATGDAGVDTSVFPEIYSGQLAAVLSGTVRQGEDTLNFFFYKEFDPSK